MSHHSSQSSPELIEAMRKVFGDYPDGKLNPNDAGALAMEVGVEDHRVVLRFPKPVAWVGMTGDEAFELAQLLLHRAREARGHCAAHYPHRQQVMSAGNVQELPGRAGLPENPIALEPRPLFYCNHSSITLDEHTRTVRCADPKCAAVLDPFEFLRTNAHLLQRAWSAYSEVMRRTNEIAERVTNLKREEQRLRAQIKRNQDKAGVINTRKEG